MMYLLQNREIKSFKDGEMVSVIKGESAVYQRINSNSKYSQEELNYNSTQIFKKNNSITDEFDRELLNWAGELLEKRELGSYGYMISLLYSGEIDAFYALLKENPGGYGTFSS